MLLGARQFFERRGKSAPTARDYVQDGLIAMWDGIENAGFGQHDPNATTWVDLVGSHDMSVTGSDVWDSVSFILAKTKYARLKSSVADVATMEIVCDLTGGWSGRRYVVAFTVSDSVSAYVRYLFVVSGRAWFTNRSKVYSDAGMNTAGTLACCFLGGSDNTVDRLYYDGVEVPGTIINDWWSSSQLGVNVNVASYWAEGHLYGIRLYSRALTAAEIAANYAIDKARFNLP